MASKKKSATAKNDVLNGSGLDETIDGLAGNDRINGLAGNDIIIGNLGADALTGGKGNDIFLYRTKDDSASAAGKFDTKRGDTIKKFESGIDKIDLTAFGVLVFNGSVPKAGSVWSEIAGKFGYVHADVTGDGVADLSIRLTGGKTLTAADLLLATPPKGTVTLAATADNQVQAAEVKAGMVTLTGTVTGDAKAGDTVTVTVNKVDYTAKVGVDLSYKVEVKVADLAGDADKTVEVRVEATTDKGVKGLIEAKATYVIDKAAPVITSATTASFDEAGTGPAYVAKVDDASGQVTWSIGGADKDLFVLDADGSLRFKAAPDADVPKDQGADNHYEVTLTATNALGVTADRAVTITVTGQNTAGGSIELDIGGDDVVSAGDVTNGDVAVTGKVTGNIGAGAVVTLTVNSKDYFATVSAAGTFTVPVKLADLVGDPDRTIAASATATAPDGTTATITANGAYTISNPGPNITSGTQSSVVENTPVSTAVYQALADVPVTWTLGGLDADDFNIDQSGRVTFKEKPNFENPKDDGKDNKYDITVTATDNFGTKDSADIRITVTDENEVATLATITMLDDFTGGPLGPTIGYLGNVRFIVTFDREVIAGGMPKLKLNILDGNGNNAVADYVSGSDSKTLIFRYVVGDQDNAQGLPDIKILGFVTSPANTLKSRGDIDAVFGAQPFDPPGTVLVDSLAPVAADAQLDSPSNQAGGTTTVATSRPAFSGTAEPGGKVIVFLDSIIYDQVTVTSNGTWSWQSSTPIENGTHNFQFVAVDQSGNEAQLWDTITITINAPASILPQADPVASLIADDPVADFGAVDGGDHDPAPDLPATGHTPQDWDLA